LPSTERLDELREQVPLAPLTTLVIGGPARWFVEVKTPGELERACRWSRMRGVATLVLGGGSNLLVSDAGFDGLVIHIRLHGVTSIVDGADVLVTAAAGDRWDDVVAACVAQNLGGLECLSGIPGTVGGTPIQNVGAYGQDVSGTIEQVTAYDTATGVWAGLRAADCGFSYRTSRFKGRDAGRFVVSDVTYRLRPGAPTVTYPDIAAYFARRGVSSPDVQSVRNAVLEVRRGKGMVIDAADSDTRSVGSFFMNPVVSSEDRDRLANTAGARPPAYPADGGRVKLSAAWLIEHAGFHRGDADGPVAISAKHTLALANRGGATAQDVLRLATRIKRGVLDRFGINLRPEPVFVGFERNDAVDFLQS
jgi:UDP-N-acetylmuramate dehydrogenase